MRYGLQLVVHIGTTKTGSTNIQRFLMENREVLKSQGICYPISIGVRKHPRAGLAAKDENSKDKKIQELRKKLNLESTEAFKNFQEGLEKDYKSEIYEKDYSKVIISEETLHYRLNTEKQLKRFKNLFGSDFDEIKIIVYVRPQLDQLVSLYSTELRFGKSIQMDNYIKVKLRSEKEYFDIKALIKRWASVFGSENIKVRPYKGVPPRDQGGVVADFCKLAGIDYTSTKFKKPNRPNSSIDARGQQLLRILNRGNGIDKTKRKHVVRWIEKYMSGAGEKPDPDLAKRFQDYYIDGNKWVVDHYFPGHKEYMESSLLKLP